MTTNNDSRCYGMNGEGLTASECRDSALPGSQHCGDHQRSKPAPTPASVRLQRIYDAMDEAVNADPVANVREMFAEIAEKHRAKSEVAEGETVDELRARIDFMLTQWDDFRAISVAKATKRGDAKWIATAERLTNAVTEFTALRGGRSRPISNWSSVAEYHRDRIEKMYPNFLMGSGGVTGPDGGEFGTLLCHELHMGNDPAPAGLHFGLIAEKWGIDFHTLGLLVADHCDKLCPCDIGKPCSPPALIGPSSRRAAPLSPDTVTSGEEERAEAPCPNEGISPDPSITHTTCSLCADPVADIHRLVDDVVARIRNDGAPLGAATMWRLHAAILTAARGTHK